MSKIVNTVEDKIQNASLTAIDGIVAPKIEIAIRSINLSSGQDATSVTVSPGRGQHVRIIASIENASCNNNVPHKSIVDIETQNNIPDEVSELLAPETRFNRQTHTHNRWGQLKSGKQKNGGVTKID